MVLYLVNMAHAFLPAAVAVGLTLSLVATPTPKRLAVFGTWSVLLGLAAGAVLYIVTSSAQLSVEGRTVIRLMAMVAMVLALPLALRPQKGRNSSVVALACALTLAAALGAEAMFDFLSRSADQSLTATSVLNTELIQNIAALGGGAVLLAALAFLVAHQGRAVGFIAGILLLILLVEQIVSASGDALLGLLQAGALDVSPGRVSYVAKVTQFAALSVYLHLALIAVLSLMFFRLRPRVDAATDRILRRKQRARALSETRWLKATVTASVFLVATLLYHDLYASLPPTLSEALEVTPSDDGLIRIKVENVKDGTLHRYAYIASDGHKVRFFLINRYDEEHVKMGVVYDACMICGDDGYIQDGNEVICIACNVRIFIPSIGKPGGCNPIPLDHETDGATITIAAAELEKGAKYFSEIVEIEVADPVTGDKLINLKAPFQYEFKGKTFYFKSKDSYETFRDDPEKYAGKINGRYFRVQGFQTGER